MGEHNHPEITMNSMPMAQHMPPILANDWEAVAGLMAASAHKVAKAGADFAICPDNTYHQAFKYLIPQSPIPWLHIAKAVAEEANTRPKTTTINKRVQRDIRLPCNGLTTIKERINPASYSILSLPTFRLFLSLRLRGEDNAFSPRHHRSIPRRVRQKDPP